MDVKQVTARDGTQRRIASAGALIKRFAQPSDGHLHALRRSRRHLLSPQRVKQLIGRDRTIGMHHQKRKQRDLPRSADLHKPVAAAEPHRAKNCVPAHHF